MMTTKVYRDRSWSWLYELEYGSIFVTDSSIDRSDVGLDLVVRLVAFVMLISKG
jgi:hypothetical protein